MRWAALLGTLGEADTRRVLKRLRCSNACIEETAVLVREVAGHGVCRSFSEDRPLGWDPAAAGSRAGDGMVCNSSDCRLRRKQGVAVGAAASRMRVLLKARSIRWVPQLELVSEEKAPAHAPERVSDIHLRQLLGRYGLCTVERLCALCAALHPQDAPACALAAQRARQLEADGVCCRVSQLAVNGRDLMAAGIPAGPALRRVLETLLDGVIRAEYPNEKPALLAAAQKIIAS